jgi:flagellar motor switch/type III secretory pathway protein FliN
MSGSAGAGAVPILLLGDSRRRRLLERVRALVAEWHLDWASEGVAPPLVEFSGTGLSPAEAHRESVRLAAFVEEEPSLLCARVAPDFIKALCAGARERLLPMGSSARGQLESELTAEVAQALCLALLRAALPSVASSVRRCDATELEQARLGWRQKAIVLAVSAAGESGCRAEIALAPPVADALLGQRPKASGDESLVVRRQAADGQQVSLTVTLGSASVSWQDLRSLGIGDAILLDQPLEEPCKVSVGGSRTIADAHLGRAGKSLAIQIARVHSAPQLKERREMR